MGGCDLVSRVPLTLPVADRVPVPRFLGGFLCTGCRVPVEENEEVWVGLYYYC